MPLDERLRHLHDQLSSPADGAGLDTEAALAVVHRRARQRRLRRTVLASATAVVFVIVLVGMVAATRSDRPERVATGSSAAAGRGPETRPRCVPPRCGGTEGGEAQDRDLANGEAVVAVSLEPTGGIFIEGFEVGLRFSTGDGEEIASTLWSDDVVSASDDPSLDDYYDHVLVQPVPGGTVVVEAQVNVGEGPPPATPDLDGPMECRLEVWAPAGSVARVEVRFSSDDRCLASLGEPTPIEALGETTATTEPAATTSIVGSTEEPVTTTSLVPLDEGAPSTTTEIEAAPVTVGSSHVVDVDLQCQAFVLGGSVWRLEAGSSTDGWQPSGERHEGGTFTLTSPGRGEFVGDAARTKVAMFSLNADDPAACVPVPR